MSPGTVNPKNERTMGELTTRRRPTATTTMTAERCDGGDIAGRSTNEKCDETNATWHGRRTRKGTLTKSLV